MRRAGRLLAAAFALVATTAAVEPPRPRPGSLAYRLSPGLAATRADRAYGRGATGSGVVVALIDTGIDAAPADLFANVSPASTDLIADRQRGAAGAAHGRQTAELLDARSGRGSTVGIAYGATLLEIRADIDGSCADQCSVRGPDLARGIDYALAHGARVIGVPLVGPRPLPSVEPALARAAAAGAVIVAAAGNDGAAAPAWPARYAADPRFRDAMIVAGATTWRGGLASWSNRAAAAAERFIAAPGDRVPVGCDARTCSLVSGTSYAVPYVAGAVSLLLSRFPTLRPQDAAALVLASGVSRGGTVPGRGVLDIARAMRAAERFTKAA